MAAAEGNRFWMARTKHGKDKLFQSEEILWEAACEYFEWVEDNPLTENKVAQYQGKVVEMPVDKMRAMTIDGLCLFLGISRQTWYDYVKRDDYVDICAKIESVIRSQKFAGAAADLLNPSIIARDLGLSDRTTLTVKDGGKHIAADMTPQDAARAYQELMADDE